MSSLILALFFPFLKLHPKNTVSLTSKVFLIIIPVGAVMGIGTRKLRAVREPDKPELSGSKNVALEIVKVFSITSNHGYL